MRTYDVKKLRSLCELDANVGDHFYANSLSERMHEGDSIRFVLLDLLIVSFCRRFGLFGRRFE